MCACCSRNLPAHACVLTCALKLLFLTEAYTPVLFLCVNSFCCETNVNLLHMDNDILVSLCENFESKEKNKEGQKIGNANQNMSATKIPLITAHPGRSRLRLENWTNQNAGAPQWNAYQAWQWPVFRFSIATLCFVDVCRLLLFLSSFVISCSFTFK